MIKEYYVIVDEEDREVNFYDAILIPNALNRAIQSAKQVDGGIVLHRKTDQKSGEKRDNIVWP